MSWTVIGVVAAVIAAFVVLLLVIGHFASKTSRPAAANSNTGDGADAALLILPILAAGEAAHSPHPTHEHGGHDAGAGDSGGGDGGGGSD
ncbi:hypothetical protein sos41_17780 [Alphaproteobacteria bacterium SO-S41]|nr:hypothetical protein sos41_17780 [Alphaproteobacteria bacterium SO-S41]